MSRKKSRKNTGTSRTVGEDAADLADHDGASCPEVLVLGGSCGKHVGGEGPEGIFVQVSSAEALCRASVRLVVTQLGLIWVRRRQLAPRSQNARHAPQTPALQNRDPRA